METHRLSPLWHNVIFWHWPVVLSRMAQVLSEFSREFAVTGQQGMAIELHLMS